MGTGTLVSVEEYLSTSYRPDCDYIDGAILERNVGEYDHARLQAVLTGFFITREKQWLVRVLTEIRVQVSSTRFRISDLCLILASAPVEQIVRTPPFICVEILSKDDTVESLQDRIDDYLTFGVRYVWVINPRTQRVFVYTSEGMHEPKDGVLRTENPEIVVPLAEVFASLE
jgi:Uma2 family endonuclease